MRIFWLTVALGLAALSGAAFSGENGSNGGGAPTAKAPADDSIRARLVSERTGLVPGETAWLGASFDIGEGLHLYGNGASDSGLPIAVVPRLPEGFAAGKMEWPAPRRLVSPGDLLDYVYEGRVTLLVPVRVPETAKPGSRVEFSADLKWLACREACVPGKATVRIELPVVEKPEDAGPSPDADRFAEARARIPKPFPTDDPKFHAGWKGTSLEIEAEGAERLAFFAAAESLSFDDKIAKSEVKGSLLRMNFVPAKDGGGRAAGIVEVIRGGSDKEAAEYYALDLPLPAKPAPGNGEERKP